VQCAARAQLQCDRRLTRQRIREFTRWNMGSTLKVLQRNTMEVFNFVPSRPFFREF
jgi:hypothetical protein